MIGTIARVVRAEGIASAIRRANERVSEAMQLRVKLASSGPEHTSILNVLATPPAPRLGGLQIQLNARLREERTMRDVALFYPGILEWSSHARRVPDIETALKITGARAIVFEGTSGDFENAVFSLHDLTQLHERLDHARALIFPSAFLRDEYRIGGLVIEPGPLIRPSGTFSPRAGRRHSEISTLAPCERGEGGPFGSAQGKLRPAEGSLAYAGSIKPYKGGILLPEIIAAFPNQQWHIFGGGDEDLLRPLRRMANAHGYYRAGELPSLLARHNVGLVLLPSIVPESYGLTLSECWLANVPVVAFDHGAYAERIRDGGWLVPPAEGAAGIINTVRRWLAGEITTTIPSSIATARDAALTHIALYRELGFLD
jgi:glycosyltransferase involved in cell wall biosynthesis